jgi:hypothetical protein
MDNHVYVVAYVFKDGNGNKSSYDSGSGFVIAGPLTYSSDTYDYGSVEVSGLGLDSGYNGTVMFETRWYGVGDSYGHYVSSCVIVTVDTTSCSRK